MIIVADTSPLNYLIRLGQVDILQTLWGRVLVPCAVLNELQHLEAPTEVRTWALALPSWIEKVSVKQIDIGLPLELGQGEREAISLALEVKADLLLIDERAGRQEAQARNLEVTGTLAILLQASLSQRFEFPEIVKRLRHFGFRVSRALEADILDRYDYLRNARDRLHQ